VQVITGTVYGVNLISVISLVNCSRVRDPTTVAGKVFQSLITVGKFEYILYLEEEEEECMFVIVP
jgi:hypothetical protein